MQKVWDKRDGGDLEGALSKKTTEEWGRLIAEQAGSGKSVMEFCRQHGISDNRLYYWRKRILGNEAD